MIDLRQIGTALTASHPSDSESPVVVGQDSVFAMVAITIIKNRNMMSESSTISILRWTGVS
jgi:hypothetical protein